MAELELEFTQGLYRKTFFVGLIITALSSLFGDSLFVVSVFVGVMISTLNMLAVGWIGSRLLASGGKGNSGSSRWLVLIPLKLFALLALTFYVVVIVEADVIGFLIGFSVFFISISWQLIKYYPRFMTDEPPVKQLSVDDEQNSTLIDQKRD